MQIKDVLLTPGSQHGRPGTTLTPKGVTVHYVGNPGSTATANRNYFENGAGGAYSSAHYIIGLDGEILRLIPENERAMHAGKSYAPQYDVQAKKNNSTYIGIECCHPDAGGQFNNATYTSLIALCADICKRYGFLPQTDVVRHYDITGKSCPLYYKNNTSAWDKMRSDIALAIGHDPVPSGSVKVRLDGLLYTMPADNIGDNWYIYIAELGGLRVKLADALISAGFTISWDAPSATVIAKLR